MRNRLFIFYFLVLPFVTFGQKDSLALGDRYAEDQIYFTVSYNQFFDQPSPMVYLLVLLKILF